MQGRVLTIHLVEGTASGLQTAVIDNLAGIVYVAPKTDLVSLLQQPEIAGFGVYVLIGDDPNQLGKNIIYIGQGKVKDRLTLHSKDTDKDFWNSKTLVIVATDNCLFQTECLYLESRLIDLAKKSGVAEVRNQTNPPPQSLTPTRKTPLENFLSQIQILLPVLNIDYFTQPPVVTQKHINSPTPSPSQNGSSGLFFPRFVFVTGGLTAEAELVNSKFVVIKGSLANPTEAASVGKSNSALRTEHRSSGKLVDDTASGKWIFSEDVAFNSPSAAAAVVSGFSVAGPQVWKIKDTQQTYGAWQQAQVDLVSSPTVP